jgi:hypothetical protein
LRLREDHMSAGKTFIIALVALAAQTAFITHGLADGAASTYPPRCQLRSTPTSENLCETRLGKFGLTGPVVGADNLSKYAVESDLVVTFGLTGFLVISGREAESLAVHPIDNDVTGSLGAAQ